MDTPELKNTITEIKNSTNVSNSILGETEDKKYELKG